MRIDILTLFPKMFDGVLGESMLKRAQAKKLVSVKIHNLRDWTADRHRTADDTPYGGGPGMVMMVEPIYNALADLGALRKKNERRATGDGRRIILLTPQGVKLTQRLVRELSAAERLVMICGHYEGVDERIRSLVTDEISIGDYILTCGEIPAMALVDAVARLVPGVVGKPESLIHESFEKGLLEYPQYTRPRAFKGMKVPKILFGGDHKTIEKWRFEESLKRTKARRPDLLQEKHASR
jgi:tRNA (guanine37-N1)-methyltransferase